MNANVLFSKLTAAKFSTITPNNGTFYRVTKEDGSEDLYLGNQKLNNANDLQAAIEGLTAGDIAYGESTVEDILDTLLGEVGDEGSIAKMINDAIVELTGSATIATKTGKKVTIKAGIVEVDGKVDNSEAADIELADVASTGKAEDVAVTDVAGNLDATNVEDALAEIIGKINSGNADSKVTMEKATGASVADSKNVAEYTFYQGVTADDNADAKELKKIGTINIAKDMVATSGELVEEDGEGNQGTFIKMTIANGTPFYINVADLIEYNSYHDTDEIKVTAYTAEGATHTYQFTIGKIAASKIVYKAATEDTDEETVAQALSRLDAVAENLEDTITEKIKALDGDVDADMTGDANASDTEAVAVVTGVTEEDGVVIGVDSVAADKAGAASRAKAAVIGTTSDAKTADTVNGAKAYADDAVTTALTWNEVE